MHIYINRASHKLPMTYKFLNFEESNIYIYIYMYIYIYIYINSDI